MTKVHKYVLCFCKAILWLLAVNFCIRYFVDPDYTKYGGWIAGFLLPLAPNLVKKLFKHPMSFRTELLYYIFIFVALDLGICWDLYRIWLGFDKIVHFASGVATSIVAYYLIVLFKEEHAHRMFRGLFIVFFSVTVAVAWEFFEFSCDRLLGQHMQELVATGVGDTMYDLLAATLGAILGGIIFAIPSYRKFLEK